MSQGEWWQSPGTGGSVPPGYPPLHSFPRREAPTRGGMLVPRLTMAFALALAAVQALAALSDRSMTAEPQPVPSVGGRANTEVHA